MADRLAIWKDAAKSIRLADIKYVQKEDRIEVKVRRTIEAIHGEFNSHYTINHQGEVKVVSEFILAPYFPVPELPRIGMQTIISSEIDNVNWYGRGPHENYADRKTSARIGQYESTVSQMGFDYIRPQENGYRTDTRSLSLSNENGMGMQIIGQDVFCFNTQQYNRNQYEKSGNLHPTDLKEEEHHYLNIDHKQMGVGGDNSWGAEIHEEYKVLPHEYYYSFIVRPLKNN